MKNAVMLEDGFAVPLIGDQENTLLALFQDQLTTTAESLALKKIKPSLELNPDIVEEPEDEDIDRER
jgi:hypothetical protein